MTITPYSPDIFDHRANTLFDEAVDDLMTRNLLARIGKKHEPTLQHSVGVGRIMSGIVTSTEIKNIIENPVRYVRDGLLHDIGKISIDSSILNWHGRLSEQSMNRMKDHSAEGFAIVRAACKSYKGTLEPDCAVRILLSHYSQPEQYPSKSEVRSLLEQNDVDPCILDDSGYMFGSIGLSIADHFEARFPDQKKDESAHGYGNRNYKAGILPDIIKSDLLQSEVIDSLGFIIPENEQSRPKLDERLFWHLNLLW